MKCIKKIGEGSQRLPFFWFKGCSPYRSTKGFRGLHLPITGPKKRLSVAPLESKPFEAPVVVAVATPTLSFLSLRIPIYMTSGRYKVNLFRLHAFLEHVPAVFPELVEQKISEVAFLTGQPLGYYGSWSLFSLSVFLMNSRALRENFKSGKRVLFRFRHLCMKLPLPS